VRHKQVGQQPGQRLPCPVRQGIPCVCRVRNCWIVRQEKVGLTFRRPWLEMEALHGGPRSGERGMLPPLRCPSPPTAAAATPLARMAPRPDPASPTLNGKLPRRASRAEPRATAHRRCRSGGIALGRLSAVQWSRERKPVIRPRDARHRPPAPRRLPRYHGSCDVGFYNRKRLQSALDYLTPVQAEKRADRVT